MSEDHYPRVECIMELRDMLDEKVGSINTNLKEVTSELSRLSSYSIETTNAVKTLQIMSERHDSLLVGRDGGNGLNLEVKSLCQSRDNLRKGLYALWGLVGASGLGKMMYELFWTKGSTP